MTANTSVPKRGIDLLRDPQLNKSTAFTAAERETLGLTGLLPAAVDTEETQVRRALQQLGQKPTDLERYIYLIQLLDTDETLFYKVLMSDPARFLPIVYDPTVGEACLKFGHIFRRPRGLYVSLEHRGRAKEVLRNWPEKDVRVICATSGERILGLGDLGANGMGIPIGKLQLYTACAAVPPQYLLPVHIDFGTNNRELLDDPLYLGLRQPRVSTAERDEFVEEFVEAMQEVFPDCCLHFEDWAGGGRDASPGPLPGPRVLLQRRHPGHGGRGPGGDTQRSAVDRRQAARPAGAVPGGRLGGGRDCRPDRLGHDA